MNLTGKKIIVAVTGSIAAYKTPHLVRLLVKTGAEVKVITTPAAEQFVSPLALATVAKHPVLNSVSDGAAWNNHVELGLWADALLIAPCSANTLAKLAHGLCDTLVNAVYLSARCPVFIAPAMDEDMWIHASTRQNLQTVRGYGNHIIPVAHGELASGLVGDGRMAEPEHIVKLLAEFFNEPKPLAGKKALVTAGPTYERLDPVRFIGNFSTGKMGVALAESLAAAGAEVTLVLGPSHQKAVHPAIKTVPVESAEEMYTACLKVWPQMNIGILAAAVADYRPAKQDEHKIKKDGDTFELSLTKTKDILATLGSQKAAGQVLIGFALETRDELSYAEKKLHAKNADAIVLNSLRDEGAGFGHDTNKITIVYRDGQHREFPLQSKQDAARVIIEQITTIENMNRKLYSLLLLCLLGALGARAQELNCKVKVMHEKITGVDKDVFSSMERNITEFLNSRKWTSDDVQQNERIDCNILINLTGVVGSSDPDAYTATINISATRPVYNSGYTSTTLNYIDRDVAFRYNQYTNLQFDDNRVAGTDALASNLTAVLAYYAYLVIGLDYDSFSKNGGTPYFKKAQNIVNNAPDQNGITGWKAFEDKRNRYWIMDQILSPRYQSLRDYWYTFHREGLDIMYNKPADGRAKVLGGIAGIGQLQKDNPGATLIQFFFNAKSDELIRIIAQEPKQARAPYVNTLAQVDVANAARYNALK